MRIEPSQAFSHGLPYGRRRFRLALRITVIGLLFGLFMLAGAFLSYTHEVSRLANATPDYEADAIVVLTGGKHRIETGLEMLRQGVARRLLITGVYPHTSRRMLRRTVAAEEGWFDCCVDIDRDALDTVGNAEQASDWVRRFGFTSLIVVTSDYHMPRSLIEFRRRMPDLRIVPRLVASVGEKPGELLASREGLRTVAPEFFKYLAARFHLGLRQADSRTSWAQALNLR